MADDGSAIAGEGGLREVYGPAAKAIREKDLPAFDRHSRRFIALSPFFCIGSSRADGAAADVSPRGGEPGFVHVLDDMRLAFPDRPGNNRLDTLTNITANPEVGLLFFVPGVEEMLRVNGRALIYRGGELMARFTHEGKAPRSVIVVEVKEVYFHCSKALRRSDLWNPDKRLERGSFPTLGQIARDQYRLPVPSIVIDLALRQDAKKNLY